MVYQDISKPVDLNKIGTKKSVAHLMDRFFSFLIDYFVISPFVFFLLYATFNNGFNFWKSNPTAPENDLFIIIAGVCYVLYFSLIQSLFIAVWRATPGQFFLKVKIEFNENENLIFFRAFLRQSSFWFSFVFIGIPFLSVMTNKLRHTFYDRLCNCSVISTKEESAPVGFENEFKYWQSFMATLVVFVGLLFTALIWKNYSKVVQRVSSFTALQEKQFFCDELKSVSVDERLPVAIALNLANQLSDDCLDKESDFVLWKQRQDDYSMAYYAKSLTTDDADKEKSYLKQACVKQDMGDFRSLTLGCKIASSFADEKLEDLYAILTDKDFLNTSLKYELSLVLDKTDEVETNFAKIEKFNSLKIIKKYQVVEMLSRKGSVEKDRSPASSESESVGDDNSEKLLKLIGEL
ncbi:RDD family protein [bacterium]|nr:RDD family protein [bacterium]